MARTRRGITGAAVVTAMVAHLLLLAGLLASLRPLVVPEPPVIEAILVRPDAGAGELVPAAPADRSLAPRSSVARRVLSGVARSTRTAPNGLQAAPVPAPPGEASPSIPTNPPGPRPTISEPTRSALRSAIGCDDGVPLNPDEQRACDQRRAAAVRQGQNFGVPPAKRRAFDKAKGKGPKVFDAHKALRPDWDCAAGGSLGCRPPIIGVGVKIPFGYVPPRITPIDPHTLRGDDNALAPKTPPKEPATPPGE